MFTIPANRSVVTGPILRSRSSVFMLGTEGFIKMRGTINAASELLWRVLTTIQSVVRIMAPIVKPARLRFMLWRFT